MSKWQKKRSTLSIRPSEQQGHIAIDSLLTISCQRVNTNRESAAPPELLGNCMATVLHHYNNIFTAEQPGPKSTPSFLLVSTECVQNTLDSPFIQFHQLVQCPSFKLRKLKLHLKLGSCFNILNFVL